MGVLRELNHHGDTAVTFDPAVAESLEVAAVRFAELEKPRPDRGDVLQHRHGLDVDRRGERQRFGLAVIRETRASRSRRDYLRLAVAALNNTAAIAVVGNTAGGNLQCSGNSSISGSGNKVFGKKQGQCATF